MKERVFSRREVTLMLILVIVALAGVYYLFVHRPVTEQLAQIESTTQSAEDEMIVLNAKKDKMVTMRAELDEIYATTGGAEIPAYDNLQQITRFLNKVLSNTTDYSVSFERASVSDEDAVARRNATLRFTCSSYKQAYKVIEQLQNCEYCCRLNTTTMTPGVYWEDRNLGIISATPAENTVYHLFNSPVEVTVVMTFYESTAGTN